MKSTRRGLLISGVVGSDEELPPALQNKIIKKSKRDSLGQIEVARFSGVVRNKTSKVLRKFERELTEGKEDIIEKMEALEGDGKLSKEQFSILDTLRKRPKLSLERAIAEAGARPLAVMDAYAKGCIAISKTDALIRAHQGLPNVVKDLFRHAIDGTSICDVCVGAGMVPNKAGDFKLSKSCPRCRGTGEIFALPSELKEFAVQKLLEITKMTEKNAPVVNVQTNVGVKVGSGAGVLERLSLLSDEILYGKREAPIEAEVVREAGAPVEG